MWFHLTLVFGTDAFLVMVVGFLKCKPAGRTELFKAPGPFFFTQIVKYYIYLTPLTYCYNTLTINPVIFNCLFIKNLPQPALFHHVRGGLKHYFLTHFTHYKLYLFSRTKRILFQHIYIILNSLHIILIFHIFAGRKGYVRKYSIKFCFVPTPQTCWFVLLLRDSYFPVYF